MTDPSPSTSVRKSLLTPRGMVLIAVVVGMLFTSVYPLGRYLAVKGEIAALERTEAALSAEAVELARERERLQDPAEIERLARERLGYVRPGEIPFAIVGPRATAEEPPRIVLPEADEEPTGLLARWWTAVGRAVSGT